MNNQDFGKFISTLRKEKGITQIELAERLNVSDKAISRWENGKNYPDVETFESLGEELGVSISELIACKRIKSPEQAEKETAKKFIEEINKRTKIEGIIKQCLFVFFTIIIEIVLGYLLLMLIAEFFDNNSIITDKSFYCTNCIGLTLLSLILSVINFSILMPRIAKRYRQSKTNVFFTLLFLFIIIGALQIAYVGYNGAGVLCFLLNGVNIYPLSLFAESGRFIDITKFACLFIIGCLVKPICFCIGNKIANES